MFLAPRERLLAGDVVVLDGTEAHHAATVRRVAVGEAVRLVDGTGLGVDGEVSSVSRGEVVVAVRERLDVPQPLPRLVVVQALAKGEHAERGVEVMTEVGVDEIVPWAASRSVVQWRDERGAKALTKWRTAAREAAKQSRRTWFPVVSEQADTEAVRERLRGADAAIVCHERAAAPLANVAPPAAGEVVLVIGPEGGLSDEELSAFAAVGASAYRLGPTVLRTSTAGAVAAAVVLSRTPRWLGL